MWGSQSGLRPPDVPAANTHLEGNSRLSLQYLRRFLSRFMLNGLNEWSAPKPGRAHGAET